MDSQHDRISQAVALLTEEDAFRFRRDGDTLYIDFEDAAGGGCGYVFCELKHFEQRTVAAGK